MADINADTSNKDEVDGSINLGCTVCGLDNNPEDILLCDGCNGEYHLYCLVPPLNDVPEGDFYCQNCVGKDSYEVRASKEEVDTYSLKPTHYFGVFCRWRVKANMKANNNPYVAELNHDTPDSMHLGHFQTEELAAEAYDIAYVKSRKEKGLSVTTSKMNYPLNLRKYEDIIQGNKKSTRHARAENEKVKDVKPENDIISTKRRFKVTDDDATSQKKKRKANDPKPVESNEYPSKYIGVSLCPDSAVANIKILDKSHIIGSFPTEAEAALAYDREAIRYLSRNAQLNFPERRAELSKEVLSTPSLITVSLNRYNKSIDQLNSWMSQVGQTVKLIEASRRVHWDSFSIDSMSQGPVIKERYTSKDKRLRKSCQAVLASVDSIIEESKIYQEMAPTGMFLNPPPAGCFLELDSSKDYIRYCEAITEFSKTTIDPSTKLEEVLTSVFTAREVFHGKRMNEELMIQELDEFMKKAIRHFSPSLKQPYDDTYFPNCKYVKRVIPHLDDDEVKPDVSMVPTIQDEVTSTHPNKTREECCLAIEKLDGTFELYQLSTLERITTDANTPLQWSADEVSAHEIDESEAFTFGLNISPDSAMDISPQLYASFMHELVNRRLLKEAMRLKERKNDHMNGVLEEYSQFMATFPRKKELYEKDLKKCQNIQTTAKHDSLFLESIETVMLSTSSESLSACMGQLKKYIGMLHDRRDEFTKEYEYYTTALLEVNRLKDHEMLKTSYVSFFTNELLSLWREKSISLETLYLLLRSINKAAGDDLEANNMLESIHDAIAFWDTIAWPKDIHENQESSTSVSPVKVKSEVSEAIGELTDVIHSTLSRDSSALQKDGNANTKRVVLVLYHPLCIRHETPPNHPECPARLRRAIEASKSLLSKFPTSVKLVALRDSPEALSPPETTLLLVHSPNYLKELKTQSLKNINMDTKTLVFETHPGDDNDGVEAPAPDSIRPFSTAGGAFKVAKDLQKDSAMDTYVCSASWIVARLAAGIVCKAVDKVLNGEVRNAVCLVRPPGHHVGRNGRTPTAPSSGFCLLNNVVIGAVHARMNPSVSRIAVLDWDIHHGNGTEELLRGDPRSFFSSVHLYQDNFFPGTGPTASDPNIVNVGLANSGIGSGSAAFRDALSSKILPAMENFKPDIIFISAGFDGHKDDIIGGCAAVSNHDIPAGYDETDYAWATKEVLRLAERCCNGRVVSVLEGGYDVRNETNSLSKSIQSHIDAIVEENLSQESESQTKDEKITLHSKYEGLLAKLLGSNIDDALIVDEED